MDDHARASRGELGLGRLDVTTSLLRRDVHTCCLSTSCLTDDDDDRILLDGVEEVIA